MSKYTPCPGCGKGSFIPRSKSFWTHFHKWCPQNLLNDLGVNASSPSTSFTSSPPRLAFGLDNYGKPARQQCLVQTRQQLNFKHSSAETFSHSDPITHPETPQSHNSIDRNPNYQSNDGRDVQIEGSYKFQIKLMDVLQQNNTNLCMHDKIIDLIRNHLSSNNLDPACLNLSSRKEFISTVERDFQTRGLKPKHINVRLSDDSTATVSTFDTEEMVLSLLNDDSLMDKSNLA